MTVRDAKSLIGRMRRARHDSAPTSRNGVMLAIIGAALVAVLAYLAVPTSRLSPARQRVEQWYAARRVRIGRARPRVHELPIADEGVVV
jgi:hypothetical protein